MLLTRKEKIVFPTSEGQVIDAAYMVATTALVIPAANASPSLVSGVAYLLRLKATGIDSTGAPLYAEIVVGVPGPAALVTMGLHQIVTVGSLGFFCDVDGNGDILVQYRNQDSGGPTHSLTVEIVEGWLLGP